MDNEFLTSFNFLVRISAYGETSLRELEDGRGAFSEVSGLEIDFEKKEVREGGYNQGVRQLIGKTSHPELVFKRGISVNTAFWRWVQRCLGGPYPLPYIKGQILVFDPSTRRDETEAAVWTFDNAIVTRVKSADLNAASSSSVPIEELHLAHEGLSRTLR